MPDYWDQLKHADWTTKSVADRLAAWATDHDLPCTIETVRRWFAPDGEPLVEHWPNGHHLLGQGRIILNLKPLRMEGRDDEADRVWLMLASLRRGRKPGARVELNVNCDEASANWSRIVMALDALLETRTPHP